MNGKQSVKMSVRSNQPGGEETGPLSRVGEGLYNPGYGKLEVWSFSSNTLSLWYVLGNSVLLKISSC